MLKFIAQKEVYGLIMIILIGALLYYISKIIINYIFSRKKHTKKVRRQKTLISLFQNLFKVLILIIIVLSIFKLYGIDVGTMVAGLGIVGIIVGLAVKDFIADMLGGLTIIVDDYFSLNDWVSFNGFRGEVIEFGLRSTKIRNAQGDTLCISNGQINQITNYSKEPITLFIDIPTAYEVKTETVIKVINGLIPKIKKVANVIPDDTLYLGLQDFKDSAIIYRLQVKCKTSMQFQVKRDVNRIIKDGYDAADLKIPYQQIEVHDGKKI